MKGAFGGQLAASAPPRGGHAGPPGSLGEAVPEPRCTRAPGQRPVCGVAGPGPTVDAGPALEPVPGPERPPPAGPRSREAPRISRPGGRPAPEAAGGGRSTGSLTPVSTMRSRQAREAHAGLSPAPSRGFCRGTWGSRAAWGGVPVSETTRDGAQTRTPAPRGAPPRLHGRHVGRARVLTLSSGPAASHDGGSGQRARWVACVCSCGPRLSLILRPSP